VKQISLILTLLLFSPCVSADTIYLKNGRSVNGKVIHQTSVYVRLEPRYLGDPEREFLVENIERIEINDIYDRDFVPETFSVSSDEVISYVSSPNLGDVPDSVQNAAREMAAALLEQAMRDVQIPNIEDAPEKMLQRV